MLTCAFCGVEPCCVTCQLSSFIDSTRQEMVERKQVVGALKPVRNGKLASEPVWLSGKAFLLTRRMFVRPNILRTLRRTMIRFLIELLVRRIWFGQSKLYFILNWLVMRCKLRPELAADAQLTA